MFRGGCVPWASAFEASPAGHVEEASFPACPPVTPSRVTTPHDMSCEITRVANISEERERPGFQGLEAQTSPGGSLRKA